MSGHKSQQHMEGCGAEVTITERVKKWNDPFPCPTSMSVPHTADLEVSLFCYNDHVWGL